MPDISPIKDIYPFQPHYFKVRDYRMHYVDEGKGNPVVMVHGNPTWSFFYRGLITEFSRTNRVIAPDHLGCGLSDKPQDFEYRLETHIDNLENLILSLDLEKITLIVHDWGGAIGMGFAVRHPQRIRSLIITNSAAFSMKRIPLRIDFCRIPKLGEFLIRRLNLFSLAALRMAVVNPLDEKTKKGYLLPYDSYENRIAVSRFVEDIPMHPEDPSYEVLLGAEHGLWMFREYPVALVWGMRDWCFSPAFLQRWCLYYPQAEVLPLESAGHYLLEDQPGKIIPFLRNFFEKHDL
ncbi:MAG: alpha/beta hydrolase [Lentisphaerae bacterium GWF2_52_8]|nr:MAG: alpha/beta hydrolase [Lentisphaerae bacterium GWF2_52_8]